MTQKSRLLALLKGEISPETTTTIERFYAEESKNKDAVDNFVKDMELNYWVGRAVDFIHQYSQARLSAKKISLLTSAIEMLEKEKRNVQYAQDKNL